MVRTQEALEGLARAPILRRLTSTELEELMRSAKVRTFQPRDCTWVEGDPIPGACFIAAGLVRGYIDDSPGRQTTCNLVWQREMPMQMPVPSDTWPMYGTAISPVVQVILPFEEFQAACLRTPQRARQVLADQLEVDSWRYAWMLAQRRLALDYRLLRFFSRLANSLVVTTTPEGLLCDFPLTHQILADLTWVKPDHVGRVLKVLVEQGYLIPRPRFRWLIPDRQRIARSIHRPSP